MNTKKKKKKLKCLKSPVSEHLWTVNMLRGPKHCLLFEKLFSLSKSERLTEPIQMQLSPNQKIFSQFFTAFP